MRQRMVPTAARKRLLEVHQRQHQAGDQHGVEDAGHATKCEMWCFSHCVGGQQLDELMTKRQGQTEWHDGGNHQRGSPASQVLTVVPSRVRQTEPKPGSGEARFDNKSTRLPLKEVFRTGCTETETSHKAVKAEQAHAQEEAPRGQRAAIAKEAADGQ